MVSSEYTSGERIGLFGCEFWQQYTVEGDLQHPFFCVFLSSSLFQLAVLFLLFETYIYFSILFMNSISTILKHSSSVYSSHNLILFCIKTDSTNSLPLLQFYNETGSIFTYCTETKVCTILLPSSTVLLYKVQSNTD